MTLGRFSVVEVWAIPTIRLLHRPPLSIMPTSDISALSSIEPPSNWSLISRMLGLSWRYRWGCTRVILLHVVVVALGLGGLGLTGVGIDLIGQELQSPDTSRH